MYTLDTPVRSTTCRLVTIREELKKEKRKERIGVRRDLMGRKELIDHWSLV